MKRTKNIHSQTTFHPPGFALIIALSLMAFMLLLTVSLTSLLQIEQATTIRTSDLQSARQNALHGLHTAIGQLQKYAGPDQRITATAEILDADPTDFESSEGANGQPIPTLKDIDGANILNRHWTGVWDSAAPIALAVDDDALSSDDPEDKEYIDFDTRTKNRHQAWLVSGLEQNSLGVASTSDTADYNRVLNFNPDPQNNPEAVLMVSGRSMQDPNTIHNEVRVSVPRVPLTDEAGINNGHYAYWVRDEGVKAQVNLPGEHYNSGNVEDKRTAFGTHQRSALELLDNFDNYQHDEDLLERIDSDTTISFLDSSNPQFDYTPFFHDIGYNIRGLLTDTRYGGLKVDLTALLSNPSEVSFLTKVDELGLGYTAPSDDSNILRIADYPEEARSSSQNEDRSIPKLAPSWQKLRSFYQMGMDNQGSINNQVTTDVQHGAHPVVTRMIINFYPIVESIGVGFEYSTYMSVQAVLWNPYNVALDTENYDLVYLVNENGAFMKPCFQGPKARHLFRASGRTLRDRSSTTNNNQNVTLMRNVFHKDNTITRRIADSSEAMAGRGFVFKVPSSTFAPGEVRVFTIDPSAASSGGFPAYTHGLLLKNTYNPDSVARLGDPEPLLKSQLYYDSSSNASLDQRMGFQWNRNYIDRTGDSSDLSYHSNYRVGRISMDRDPSGLFLDTNIACIGLAREGSVINQSFGDPIIEDDFFFRTGQTVYRRWGYAWGNSKPSIDVVGIEASSIENQLFNKAAHIGSHVYQAETAENDDTWRWRFSPDKWIDAHEYKPFFQINLASHRHTISGQARDQGNPNQLSGNTSGSDVAPGGWATDHSRSRRAIFELEYNGDSEQLNYFGTSFRAGNGLTRLTRYEVPRADFLPQSIAHLQHANLGNNQLEPANPIGNSYPDLFVPELTEVSRYSNLDQRGLHSFNSVDTSYVLNEALWDRFFFSDLKVDTGAYLGVSSSNQRFIKRVALNTPIPTSTNEIREPDTAAKHLLVNGAFNINSTSINAWKAVLGAGNRLRLDPVRNDQSKELINPVSRALFPLAYSDQGNPVTDVTNLNSDQTENRWNGFRELTEAEIDRLAKEIVNEIKNRGPAFSLAEFVNRRRVDDARGEKGTIQAAIDRADINEAIFVAQPVKNNSNPGHKHTNISVYNGSTSQGIHGHLTQADILQQIGSAISARSDTFVVRAYGNAINPINGNISGEAYCEAVIQRQPEYVDNSQPAETPVLIRDAATERMTRSTSLNDVNAQFGRAFRIVSFKWLHQDQI